MTLKYIWRSFSLGCHFHVHFSYRWHAFASHGLPAIAELLVSTAQTKNQTTIKFRAYTFEMLQNTSYSSMKTKISTTKFTRLFYSLYSRCPPFALMQARRRLRKLTIDFYRANALKCIARSWDRMSSVCLSVCPSACDVGDLWSHRLEILETNCTEN